MDKWRWCYVESVDGEPMIKEGTCFDGPMENALHGFRDNYLGELHAKRPCFLHNLNTGEIVPLRISVATYIVEAVR